MSTALSLKKLEKSYKDFTLGPIELDIEMGTTLGLIGPNGAGKTTTIQCLAGLLRANGGSIELLGNEVDILEGKWKEDIGYVSDEPAFFEAWSCEKNLQFYAQFYPSWSDERASELARRFDLDLKKKVKILSKGNRIKLALIMALSHSPKVFLFDEPTSGLDPIVRNEVLEVLWEMMENGNHAILYSTHILTDLATLADELAFLNNGKIILKSPKEELTENFRRFSFHHEGNHLPQDGLITHEHEGSKHILVTTERDTILSELNKMGISNITESRLSIDEIAIQILRGK
jgi:ABC-2 type transport system ATP-binding protein